MMNADEIWDALERRREQFNSVEVEDALSSTVDTERFYKYVASIEDIDVRDEEVHVRFYEPEAGATDLDSGYGYTVAVGRHQVTEPYQRSQMPRQELITLQQVAITIWAMATGEMY